MSDHVGAEAGIDDVAESFSLSECVEVNVVVLRFSTVILKLDVECIIIRTNLAGLSRRNGGRVGNDEAERVDRREVGLYRANCIGVEAVRIVEPYHARSTSRLHRSSW